MDSRRLWVIAVVSLLVLSGAFISASGGSPAEAKSGQPSVYRAISPTSAPTLNLPGLKPPNPVQLAIAASGLTAQSGSSEIGQSASGGAVAPAGAAIMVPPEVGYIVLKSSLFGSSRMQVEEQVILPSGETISTSGQGGFVTISAGGQMFAAKGDFAGSAFLGQPPQVFFRTYVPTNELTQQPYSSFSTLTAAIPGLWLDNSKRRTRSQIYIEILELIKRGPMTPFEIAFYARLNHKRTKDYAEFLKRTGYLETRDEDGRLIYVLTKNGLGFLDRVRSLFEENRPSSEIPNLDFGGFPVQ